MHFRHRFCFFFLNDTATTEIYPLSLHDALPISDDAEGEPEPVAPAGGVTEDDVRRALTGFVGRIEQEPPRSEEHTSELQSQSNLVCRLLLEKKKTARSCK